MSEKKVYFYKPQLLSHLIGVNATIIVAGRVQARPTQYPLHRLQKVPLPRLICSVNVYYFDYSA